MAAAWKARLATKPDGTPRLGIHGILVIVRAFYLDLAQWAVTDSYWAPWVAPSPVNRAEVTEDKPKSRRQATARTQAAHPRTGARCCRPWLRRPRRTKPTPLRNLRPGPGRWPRRHHRDRRPVLDSRAASTVPPPPDPSRRDRRGSSRTRKTSPSGPGRSWRRCATPASGSRRCSSSPTSRIQPYTVKPTGEDRPAGAHPARARPTRNASWSPAPSWSTSSPRSSSAIRRRRAGRPAHATLGPARAASSASRCRTCSSTPGTTA